MRSERRDFNSCGKWSSGVLPLMLWWLLAWFPYFCHGHTVNCFKKLNEISKISTDFNIHFFVYQTKFYCTFLVQLPSHQNLYLRYITHFLICIAKFANLFTFKSTYSNPLKLCWIATIKLKVASKLYHSKYVFMSV